jgi:pilus assembly protein FimV
MKNKKLLSLAVAGALGLLSSNGLYAFGLGKIEVNSALNQPFNAKIPVTAISTDEAEVLQVLLSSNEEFEKAGLQKTFALTDLRFDVVRRDPKNIYIKVTSDRAIKEPLLDFLITANAGGGRLIREYTVFLDPPEYVFVAPETKASKQLQSKPKPAPVYKPATTQAQTTKPTSAPVKAVSMTEYATKRNDTLWNIALLTRPDKSVSVNQMMMALLDANPTAFNRGNINSLKAGQVLTILSLE